MDKNQTDSVAIIGSKSMVASRFCDQMRGELDLIEADLDQIDITDKASVSSFFKNNEFKFVVLFSAFTDVDAAEKQRDDKNGICWKINVEGVKNIVEECKNKNCKLFFISTDFVFDGTKGPYGEEDVIPQDLKLVSWYGITKIEAEKIISQELEEFAIIRISYPYRGPYEGKEDIFKKILTLAKEDKLYPMFADQTITPTFIDDIATGFKLILAQNQTGIFHIASPEVGNWFEITKELLRVFGLSPDKVQKGSLKEFLKGEGKTPRPVTGGLKVARISELGFTPTNWKDGIGILFQQTSNS